MAERNKMQKEKELKEFRNLELLNDEQRRKQRSNEKEDGEIQNCSMWDKNSNEKQCN